MIFREAVGGSGSRVDSSSPAPCHLSTLVAQVTGKLIPLRGRVSRIGSEVPSILEVALARKASAHFLVRFEDLKRQVGRATVKLNILLGVAIDASEDVAKLNGDTLKLRHRGVVAEIFHACIIPRFGVFVQKEKGKDQ